MGKTFGLVLLCVPCYFMSLGRNRCGKLPLLDLITTIALAVLRENLLSRSKCFALEKQYHVELHLWYSAHSYPLQQRRPNFRAGKSKAKSALLKSCDLVRNFPGGAVFHALYYQTPHNNTA